MASELVVSLPAEQLERHQEAAKLCLARDDYGYKQLDEVMEAIFGDHSMRLANPVACEWDAYFERCCGEKGAVPEVVELPAMPGSAITPSTALVGILNAPGTRVNAPTIVLKLPEKRKADRQHTEDGPPLKKKPGTKPNELLDRLSVSGIDQSKTTANKHYWTCIAPTCSHKRQGRRVAAEVAAHAVQWQALGAVLKLAESSSDTTVDGEATWEGQRHSNTNRHTRNETVSEF
ncbi:hypothetical protein K438DRAFT_1997284 [Mycena galopus ATCC 62051]|nr:hypothetical protein K438DRAFT_1997284 [Mycena galopus ATCC 62051]